jgi:PEGA domain
VQKTIGRPFRRFLPVLACLLLIAASAFAKDTPQQVLDWPQSGTPVLRFSFSKFKELGSVGSQRNYVTDTTVENLSNKLIPNEAFSIYLFDKNKVRIGDGSIEVNNLGPGQSAKFQTMIQSTGTPVSISLLAATQVPRTISITVNSVPQGATLKVDGNEVGTTPKLIDVGIGKHILTFSKEGFKAGTFPLEIGPHDVSGGSTSYELGASAFDTVELRDGSVLNGDLVSISGMDIEMRVAGSLQHIDRNKVKRIMLVVRDAAVADPISPAGSN